jgi:hypothetical protein
MREPRVDAGVLARGAAWDLACRIELRGDEPAGLFLLRRPQEDVPDFVSDLAAELRLRRRGELRIFDGGGSTVTAVICGISEQAADAVLVHGLEAWGEEEWRALDLNRAELDRRGPIIFLLSADAVDRFFRYAPNLRSWLGGGLYEAASDPGLLSDAERQQRLQQLADQYQMTDEQVVEGAKRGTLPPAPEFAEWLVLLGQGELVGR